MAALEERVSRLEGIVEQINERLGSIEAQMREMRAEMRAEMREMRADTRSQFRWSLGIMLAMWATVIAAVLGALLTR